MVNVLTLRLDAGSQATFDHLRRRYFPPDRNLISAHVTLFHALPDAAWIDQQLAEIAERRQTFPVDVTGLRSLGKGVAYRLASKTLLHLQSELAHAFQTELSPQDKQRFQPHVVVQNKVTPAAAREVLTSLQAQFVPWTIQAHGLDLWHYLGGPWEHAQSFLFVPE